MTRIYKISILTRSLVPCRCCSSSLTFHGADRALPPARETHWGGGALSRTSLVCPSPKIDQRFRCGVNLSRQATVLLVPIYNSILADASLPLLRYAAVESLVAVSELLGDASELEWALACLVRLLTSPWATGIHQQNPEASISRHASLPESGYHCNRCTTLSCKPHPSESMKRCMCPFMGTHINRWMRCVSSHDFPGMTGCFFLGLADDAVLRAPIIVGVCKIAAILGPGAETTRHVPAITKALKEALRGQQVRIPTTKGTNGSQRLLLGGSRCAYRQ